MKARMSGKGGADDFRKVARKLKINTRLLDDAARASIGQGGYFDDEKIRYLAALSFDDRVFWFSGFLCAIAGSFAVIGEDPAEAYEAIGRAALYVKRLVEEAAGCDP